MKYITLLLIVFASYLLQVYLVPVFSIVGIMPDIILAFLAAIALYGGAAMGGTLGFVAGFILDVSFSAPFGFYAMQYMFVGALAGLASEIVEPDRWIIPILSGLVGYILKELMAMIIMMFNGLGAQELSIIFLARSFPSAAYTAAFMIPVCLFISWLFSLRFMKKKIDYKKRGFV